MKSTLKHLLPLCGLAATVPAFAQDPKPDAVEKKREVRVFAADPAAPGVHHLRQLGVEPAEKETVTYLGVTTAPVNETLAAQLGLTAGTGLVVNEVGDESPAENVLQKHDILTKLDDQILIETRQLSVLIRSHKKGDEVTVSYVRAGKPATAKVKLGEHKVPKIAMAMPFEQGFTWTGENGPDMGRVFSLVSPGQNGPMAQSYTGTATATANGMHATTVNTGNSNMSFSDEQGSLDLTIKEGKRSLVAKDTAGKELFSGPIDTPEQRKALPDSVRGRLNNLEGMQDYSFKPDGDFKGPDVRVFRPKGQGISIRPAPVPAIRVQPGVPESF